jgi:hypothetical protein
MYDPKLDRFTQTYPILGNRAMEHYSCDDNNPISNPYPAPLEIAATDKT